MTSSVLPKSSQQKHLVTSRAVAAISTTIEVRGTRARLTAAPSEDRRSPSTTRGASTTGTVGPLQTDLAREHFGVCEEVDPPLDGANGLVTP